MTRFTEQIKQSIVLTLNRAKSRFFKKITIIKINLVEILKVMQVKKKAKYIVNEKS